MPKLWEEAGKSIVARLVAASEPALVFWIWTAAWWAAGSGGWKTYEDTVTPLFAEGGAASLLAGVIIATILVAASGLLVQSISSPVLRVLEGYGAPGWIVRRRTAAWRRRREAIEAREVAATPVGGLTADTPVADAAEAMRWNSRLQDFPETRDVMPTRIGNILRAGERRIATAYGLDPVVVWPQFWLAISAPVREQVQSARDRLGSSVTCLVWAVLAVVSSAVLAPAAGGLIGSAAMAVIAILIWRLWVPADARSYSAVLIAAFDTQRFLLYDAMRFAHPATSSDEVAAGAELTRWIRRRDIRLALAPPATPGH